VEIPYEKYFLGPGNIPGGRNRARRYHAGWYKDDGRARKTMPYARWLELSEHGRRVARLIACAPGEVPLQLQPKEAKL
jgi:hypothetical protein